MNNKEKGSFGEKAAHEFLTSQGISVIELNYRCRFGEIDLIAKDNNTYIFVEVKFRTSNSKGYSSEAVNINKQKKICRVSDYYRMMNKINDFSPCRFDVIAIDGNDLQWIQNAFEYIPR